LRRLFIGALVLSVAGGACVQLGGMFRPVPDDVCYSKEIWAYQDKDSPQMNPGRSCVKCHDDYDDEFHAPKYTLGGTVMGHLHENDDCRGEPEMFVVVTDANGQEIKLPTNHAGNFWMDITVELEMPLEAKIIDRNGNERVKQIPVSSGDCAMCHTKEGAFGAPGRLTPPLLESDMGGLGGDPL
jgi:hypothetical protein